MNIQNEGLLRHLLHKVIAYERVGNEFQVKNVQEEIVGMFKTMGRENGILKADLRNNFARSAMEGLLASGLPAGEGLAKTAYQQADFMLSVSKESADG